MRAAQAPAASVLLPSRTARQRDHTQRRQARTDPRASTHLFLSSRSPRSRQSTAPHPASTPQTEQKRAHPPQRPCGGHLTLRHPPTRATPPSTDVLCLLRPSPSYPEQATKQRPLAPAERSPPSLPRASEGRRVGRSGRPVPRAETRVSCLLKHLIAPRGEHVAWGDPPRRPSPARLQPSGSAGDKQEVSPREHALKPTPAQKSQAPLPHRS